MIPLVPSALRPATPPLVLVVEDDPKIAEIVHVALAHANCRVITAFDGDEAIRRAMAERPDLVVLDVRLPRRGGLEVCDFLRHDPEDPHVPIVLVSASGDTEARLEGLAHGADDYLPKPFSPKELVARVQRLLARSGEARAQRKRGLELERELSRARLDARRAAEAAQSERRLRDWTRSLGRDLPRTLDPDALAHRALRAALTASGAGAAAWLALDGDVLRARALGGGAIDRWESLVLPAHGPLAEFLAALGRPLTREMLERRPELRADAARLAAAGVATLVPMRGGIGLEALLALDERPDGAALERTEWDSLEALGEIAAAAWLAAGRLRAQQDRWLERLAIDAGQGAFAARARAETLARVTAAARLLSLPERERSLSAHAIALGAWAWSPDGRAVLGAAATEDGSGRLADLVRLVEESESGTCAEDATASWAHAVALVSWGVRYGVARRSGRSAHGSAEAAFGWLGSGLSPEVLGALETVVALEVGAAA